MLCAGLRPGGTLAAACALALTLAPSRGLAQEATEAEPSADQLELARSLYYDGLALIDRQAWADAADRFERVLEIRDSIVVSYQLAVAYSQLGRQVEARDQLRRVLDDTETIDDMRAAATGLLGKVEAAMGRLTLRIAGDTRDVRVVVGGREVPVVVLDMPVLVDPGRVHVALERGGEVVTESSVEVGGGGALQVELELEVPAVEPKLAPSAVLTGAGHAASPPRAEPLGDTGPMPRDDDDGLLSQWWFWTAVGVVAAGAVVTVLALGAEPDPADPSSARGDFQPGLLEGRVEAP